jgi:hypothetical protein
MPTKYIENTGASPIFVGGKLIPPNDGRDIDVALLPPEHRDAPAPAGAQDAPSLADLVAQLQAKTVKVIAAELPQLTHEALDLLAEAESATGKPRAGVLAAIEAERLRRANERLQAENNAQDDAAYAEQLANLTAEQRAALGEPPQA